MKKAGSPVELSDIEKLMSDHGQCPVRVKSAVLTEESSYVMKLNKDPAVEKRLRRLQIVTDGGTTFEVVAREWHDMNKGRCLFDKDEGVRRRMSGAASAGG